MALAGIGISKDPGWSLEGKTALVTGGTKGIGYAIVEELAGFGAIILMCSRDESQLNECLGEWEKKCFKVTGSICDVTSRAQREDLMNKVSLLFNDKLNILVDAAAQQVKLNAHLINPSHQAAEEKRNPLGEQANKERARKLTSNLER